MVGFSEYIWTTAMCSNRVSLHAHAYLLSLSSQVAVEREQWEARMRQRVAEDRERHLAKEASKLSKLRDAEIDKTIHSLQTENVLFEKRCAAAYDSVLAQLRADFEAEKREVLRVRGPQNHICFRLDRPLSCVPVFRCLLSDIELPDARHFTEATELQH